VHAEASATSTALRTMLGVLVAALAGCARPAPAPVAAIAPPEPAADVREATIDNGWITVRLQIPPTPAGRKPAVIGSVPDPDALLAAGAIVVGYKIHWDLLSGLQPPGPPAPPAENTVGVWLDRWAFLLALVGAVTACGYIATRRAPPEFHRAYGHQLGRCVMLCAAAAAALLVTVAIETVLTGCRLYAADFSAAAAIPALTLAVELALTGVLVVHIHAVFRRARCAATLLDK